MKDIRIKVLLITHRFLINNCAQNKPAKYKSDHLSKPTPISITVYPRTTIHQSTQMVNFLNL
jgi:hypothetical protein